MKFKLNPVGSIEVTGITKVVEDQKFVWLKRNVRVNGGTNTTEKWFKYHPKRKEIVNPKESTLGEVLEVLTPIRMHGKIEHACFKRKSKVWISGDVINIINEVN